MSSAAPARFTGMYTINDTKLGDNCYYCTAAGLLGLTVSELIHQSEVMQNAGGGNLDEIAALFLTTGAGTGAYTQHRTKAALFQAIRNLDRGNASKRFGVAYRRRDGTGHMIMGQRGLATGILFFDCQTRPFPSMSDEIENAVTYYLFDSNR